MTRPSLSVVGAGSAPIELRGEDRLSAFTAPIRDASLAMVAFAAGSLAIHALLMVVAVVAARTPLVVPESHEIAVEIVRDEPKPPSAKSPLAKSPPTKAPPKPAPPKAAPLKAEQPVPAKIEQAKTEQAKPEQVQPPAPPKPAASAQKPAVADQLKAMEDELASLRAEQAALTAAETQEASGKALALPTIGSDGDAIGYQQLVFSQLAKAKGDSEYHGQAGTTGVKFEMDAAGELVRVEIVRSSGSAALDGQALDIIHRAAPFPPPPTEADRVVFANVNFVPPKTR